MRRRGYREGLFWMRGAIAMVAVVAAFLPIVFLGASTDPDILWKIVHGRCVVDETKFGHSAPCALVDLTGGYAILKDIVGQTQYLLIPTARISGIESPYLLAPGTPNYFADAWTHIGLVAARLGKPLPRQDVSLAINSVSGRTQDQLHIHMDCIRPDVRASLDQHLDAIGMSWVPYPVRLAGHPYRAMRLDGAALGGADPFRLLAEGGARSDMGAHTLVLVGEAFPDGTPGFILLDGRANLADGNVGSGEALQDHDCRIGRMPG